MKHNLIFFALGAVTLQFCQPAENKNAEALEVKTDTAAEQLTYPAYFSEVLEAHGGLAQWKQLGTMQYQLTNNGTTETHLIDLKSRKDLVKADNYTIGHDGEQVWVSPSKEAYPGKSAKFYHNLYFYFYAIPFVLADPGVNYQQLEPLELEGKRYNVIGVSFGEGIGDTPEDEYRLLIDPETNRLDWLLYTVTFFDGQPSEKFNALKYEDYQEQRGLLFPAKLTGYKYENGKIGDVRYSVSIDSLQLKEEQPAQDQFNKPAQAETES
ncbi:hypothetical protein H9Q13_06675 [Pontibacter sp. JH31]|uniref:Outer membrane lipoprotein-sorting protein n=1 Tax=Pontibacter aquaedesilientis TaxID=2766980 RepID=A0ABR7XEW7_9BACT|nr:DUF6503 family protein [Pontibacter aquaedesilientis]MBD1396843.1 hypothetical protein [Pontibacter aquaedesilientis]